MTELRPIDSAAQRAATRLPTVRQARAGRSAGRGGILAATAQAPAESATALAQVSSATALVTVLARAELVTVLALVELVIALA